MAQSVELRSLRVDGRLSIEHQLSIHINDLFDISFNFLENSNKPPENTNAEQQQGIGTGGGGGVDLTLMDVLQGLRYVMDYRIRGGKQPSIDQELMRKLAEALLIHMKHKERSILIRQRITPESELAFSLFGDFIEEGTTNNRSSIYNNRL